MGWDLKIGELQQEYVTDSEIWKALNNFFHSSKVTMSYKYGFFKSLIENLYNVNENLELSYSNIFNSFTKIYWNLTIHHKLFQSNNKNQISSIHKILYNYSNQFAIPCDLKFDNVNPILQLEIVKEVKKKGKRYVIGAFYGDTNGLFYEFKLKSEYLRFNPQVYNFLQRHQRTLIYLTNYHLAKFLEKYNDVPHINNLVNRIENISKRASLSEYYNILIKHYAKVCFYCNQNLSNKRSHVHIDHFIPWSFIQTDNLWNLVLSCPKCNVQKNNKLAINKYLGSIIDRNSDIMTKIQRDELNNYFINYDNQKLLTIYDFSIYNGICEFWEPNIIYNI